jgi:hypothetical protein
MQKINAINYALLIFGLSGASLTYSATPETIAAAINFCQERFNTSDKDECLKLVENKLLIDMQETAHALITTNFANPNSHEQAKLQELSDEISILSKHLPALRNDLLTPEMTFQCYLKLFTRTIERCNKQADAPDLSSCLVNGWLDDWKIMINTPDAIKIGKSPFSIQMIDMMAAYGQAGLESEIRRLEESPLLAHQAPFPLDGLKELLQAVNGMRAKFASIVPPFELPKSDATTIDAIVTSIIVEELLDNAAPEDKEIHD